MYDRYISLGLNTTRKLRRFYKDTPNYFDWTIASLDSLCQILDNDFTNISLKEITVNWLLDSTYNIKHFNQTAERLDYLKDRFISYANSRQRILYFIETNETKEKIIKLQKIIQVKYPKHDFDIVIIQSGNKVEKEWCNYGLYNRYNWKISDEFPLKKNKKMKKKFA